MYSVRSTYSVHTERYPYDHLEKWVAILGLVHFGSSLLCGVRTSIDEPALTSRTRGSTHILLPDYSAITRGMNDGSGVAFEVCHLIMLTTERARKKVTMERSLEVGGEAGQGPPTPAP